MHWPIYRQQAVLNGYDIVGYPLGAHYTLDVAAIERAATPATPTGAVADSATLRELLDLANERDWIVISDEAYEDFIYDGTHVSLASFEAEVEPRYRRVFSAFTFSKCHAMTGCRVGYVVAPNDELAALLRKVQEGSIIAPPTPSQVGALAAAVRTSRDAVAGDLMAAGLIDTAPAGGWYALLDVSSSGYAAERFAARLLADHGVAVTPAAAFAMPGDASTRSVVRISLAGDRTRLLEGVATLVRACREWAAELPTERLS